jgi:hypothetical protein
MKKWRRNRNFMSLDSKNNPILMCQHSKKGAKITLSLLESVKHDGQP